MAYAPFVRIFLRYGAMFLAAKGVFDQSTANALATDPEVYAALEIAVGALIAAGTELWHAMELKRAKQ